MSLECQIWDVEIEQDWGRPWVRSSNYAWAAWLGHAEAVEDLVEDGEYLECR